MMSAKLATLGLLKIKIFWNKGYGVIISVQDAAKTIISDVVMWPKFGNYSISMIEVTITSIL